MPAQKRNAAPGEEGDTEEEAVAKLSAALKKGHASRTAAIFKRGCGLSQHILGEAKRLGLDPNMVHAAYIGFVEHLLNPCAPLSLAQVPRFPNHSADLVLF